MAAHGTPTSLSDSEREALVYRCAEYPQICRNLQKRLDRKKGRDTTNVP
jgi:hypothetical protein